MAYNFNGSTQYISSNPPITAIPTTFSCWFNCIDSASAQTMMNISRTDGSTGRINLNVQGSVAGDPVRLVQIGSGGTTSADSATGYSINTWQHACGVVSSATSRTSYINGVAGTTNTTSNTTTSIALMYIAAVRLASSVGNYFSGSLMDVGVWNVALTQDEITSLSKGISCSLIRPQSLVFYAPLIRGLQELDEGLTLTNNNTATVSNHARLYF